MNITMLEMLHLKKTKETFAFLTDLIIYFK